MFSRMFRSTILSWPLLCVVFAVHWTATMPTSTTGDAGSAASVTDADDKAFHHQEQEEKELVIEITTAPPENCERTSAVGDTVVVHYKGFFSNGTSFDSSNRERGAPFKFRLGAGRVIGGWEQGLLDMCVGEMRRLTVPPHLGYGKHGFGKVIGPDETLIFEIELMEFKETETAEETGIFTFDDIDVDHDKLLSRKEVKTYLLKMGLRMAEIAEHAETAEGREKLVDRVMKLNDLDGDGFVDEHEFYRPVGGNKDEL